VPVTLNEAIEIAKRFGSAESAGFVNGVLDRIQNERGKPTGKTVSAKVPNSSKDSKQPEKEEI
jgi:N utilization substance protein B